MFKDHEHFPLEVPDDQVVWRYMDLARFLAVLQNEALWFARADLLGDPHEGATGEFNRSSWVEMYGEQMAAGLSNIDWNAMRMMFHITCWHMNERESAAMWGLYQTEGRGIAIKSTVGRLKEAVRSSSDDIYMAAVRYVDYATEFVPEGNLFYRVIHKRLSFEHENELRMIVSPPAPTVEVEREGVVETVIVPGYQAPPGLSIPVDLSAMVEAIHIAPGSADWFVDVVQRATDLSSLSTQVLRSEIDAEPLFEHRPPVALARVLCAGLGGSFRRDRPLGSV